MIPDLSPTLCLPIRQNHHLIFQLAPPHTFCFRVRGPQLLVLSHPKTTNLIFLYHTYHICFFKPKVTLSTQLHNFVQHTSVQFIFFARTPLSITKGAVDRAPFSYNITLSFLVLSNVVVTKPRSPHSPPLQPDSWRA